MLILTDNQGIPLTCSEPIEGNRNDAFNLVPTVQKMLAGLEASEIRTDGLFLNADSGIDTEEFLSYCSQVNIVGNIDRHRRNRATGEYLFGDLLYKCRFVVERTNTWFDAFKAILARFETNAIHWKALNLLAFCIVLLRKF